MFEGEEALRAEALYLAERRLTECHRELQALLKRYGARIDADSINGRRYATLEVPDGDDGWLVVEIE